MNSSCQKEARICDGLMHGKKRCTQIMVYTSHHTNDVDVYKIQILYLLQMIDADNILINNQTLQRPCARKEVSPQMFSLLNRRKYKTHIQ